MTLAPKDGGAEPPKRNTLRPGTEMAHRYVVLRSLGYGGMGTVYAVRDNHLDEDVALKLLHPDLSSERTWRQRLRGEVRLARRVSHPNVCRVHDLGVHGDQLFVTMELVRGPSLRSVLRRGESLPFPRRVDIVVQICAALAAAHRAGVLHRDVKPDNVIVEHDRTVLTDFGVASLAAELATSRRVVAGTPAYIAPEVLRGEEFDHRIDVYACAVVAYELLSGRQPFRTGKLESAVSRAQNPKPPPPLTVSGVSERTRAALETALLRGMAPAPADRTNTVDALAEAIAEAARGAGASMGEAATIHGIPDQTAVPTMTVAQRSTPVTRAAIARPRVRVATALAFSCDPVSSDGQETIVEEGVGATDTRPILLGGGADLLERTVVDLGGTPIETRTDGLLAVFGAPTSLGDDAARAARAARALIEGTTGSRAGIDTARILYKPTDRGATASGDAVAGARALLRRAELGEVLLSPHAARQLAGRFAIRERRDAAGHRARALTGDDPILDGGDRGGAAVPLLGRERELDRLDALVKEVCEARAPRSIHVCGPAGIGKSRLRAALIRQVSARREVDWLVGRATALGEVAPFSLLRSADPAWFAAATAPGNADREAAFAAARRWLEHRADRRPVAVLFEDVQWADDASIELLASLRADLADVPVALITFGRDSDRSVPTLELEPLDEGAAVSIVRAVAPDAAPHEIAGVVSSAGGNPFFLEELGRHLRERGGVGATQATPLPATVEAVVQARLDRLEPGARELVCAAAVVGTEFWRDAARAALGGEEEREEAELDENLALLERREIIHMLPPSAVADDRYAFASALVRDVAYQQLAPRERRRAHTAIANWLERRAGGRRGDPAVLAEIARHRDASGDSDRAAVAYRAAGERALAVFAYAEAAAALRRADALGAAPDPALLEKLGDAVGAAENVDAAERCYRAALDATPEDDLLRRARLWRCLGGCAGKRGDADEAVRRYERGLEIIAPGGELVPAARANPTVAALLYGSLGWVLGYQLDDNARGLPASERAVALLEDTPHRRELAGALSRLGANYMRAGRFADQLECNRRNLEIARELGDLSMQLTAHINLGVVHSVVGDIDAAIANTRAALDLCHRTGSVATLPLVQSNLAGLLLETDRRADAEPLLAEAIAASESRGVRRILPESYSFLARLRAAAGDLASAERAARTGLAIAESAGLSIDEGISARLLAAVLVRRDANDEEAEALFGRSDRLLARADEYERAKTTAARARAADARGDADAAAALRDEARDVFERLGNRLDLALVDDPDDLR